MTTTRKDEISTEVESRITEATFVSYLGNRVASQTCTGFGIARHAEGVVVVEVEIDNSSVVVGSAS